MSVRPVVRNVVRNVVSPVVNPLSDRWSSWWDTLLTATVENVAPTHVVLTFPIGKPSLLATDLSCTVNGVTRTINSASWAGGVWTVVLSSAVIYGDTIVVTFGKTGETANVTNNVLYTMLLTSVGTGAGVSTLSMEVSSDIIVTLGANAKFYTDTGGTLNESATWTITAGALRTIYLKCTTGTALMTFSDASKLIKWGDSSTIGWTSEANAAKITATMNVLVLTELYITGTSELSGALPTGLTYLRLSGDSIAWTYNGALPTGLTYLYFRGDSIAWTGLDVGNNGNIGTFNLIDYRVSKMSSTDMITLLTQMTGREGTLPATVTINDYADFAAPPVEVTDAVDALKLAKGITTVNLGA